MESMLVTATLLLCVILGIELVKIWAKLKASGKRYGCDIFGVIPVYPEDNPELKLRSCISSMRWSENVPIHKIIILDMGMSLESAEICRNICNEFEFAEICKPEDIKNIFQQQKK